MTKRKSGQSGAGSTKEDASAGIFGSLTDLLETLGGMGVTGGQQSRPGKAKAEKESGEPDEGQVAGGRFTRILGGLTEIAEKLNEISEKGGGQSQQGEFTFPSPKGGVRGVYGFSFRTGLQGEDDRVRVEPFGNVRKDTRTGKAVVQEITEPLVDVFEDENSTTLVAEMPGVGPEDISIDVRDDILTIQAQKGEKKYRKEMLLRHRTTKEGLKVACNNGVVTIRCEKAG